MSAHGGRRLGAGRPKGALNKDSADIRALVIGALQDVGGRDYLAARALDQPVAFMNLIGKVMPTQITGENGGALVVDFRWADAPPTIEAQPVSHETTDDPPAITFISDC